MINFDIIEKRFLFLFTGIVHDKFGPFSGTMENDFMNELEDFIAGTAGSPAASGMASTASAQPTSKTSKELLGERIIAKRKLEDQGNNDIMSKTQKMDHDHNSLASDPIENGLGGPPGGGQVGGMPGGMNNTPGGPQRLLEQALMQKNMGSNPANGIKSPAGQIPNEILNQKKDGHRNNEENLTSLLNEHPHLVNTYKSQKQMQQKMVPQNNVINRNMNMPPGGPNPDMMGHGQGQENPNFYGLQQVQQAQQQQLHPQQPQRLPMQPQPPQQGRPHNWNGGGMMYNGKMSMRPQGPRGGVSGAFYDPNNGGPPPNAWVQPNGAPGVQMPGPPGANPAHFRNGYQRPGPPGGMMRPNMGPGGDFNGQMYPGQPGQPHPGMRNYPMNPNSNDPYTVNRMGMPNGGNPGHPAGPGGVVQQPMYSPNNPGDSMHALRMSAANFPVNTPDSNPGYYGNPAGPGPPSQVPTGPEFNGTPQQQPPNGYRMRPNFNTPGNIMPNMMHGPRGVTNISPGGPGGLPAGPAGQMCHNGNMVEMQQPFNQPPQQQQQQPLQPQGGPMGVPQTNGGFPIGDNQHNNQAPFNNNNAGLNNNENFNEFNPMMQTSQPGGQPGQQQGQHMDHPDQSWRSRANDIRLSLLNKLKEALSSLGQGQLAESYESEAFTSANNLNEYKSKLVQWLASIYERSSSANSFAGMDFKPTGPPGVLGGGGAGIMGGVDIKNSPPDSSTNGLTDMVSSTSPKVHDQSCNPNDLVESSGGPASIPTPGGKPEESMLATPKSESCLSPTSSPSTSAVNSPLATTVSVSAAAASSAASAASTTMTGTGKVSSPTASSTTSSSGGTTFQCPPPAMPPMDPSIGMGPAGLEQGSKTGNGNVASTQPQNRTGANPINSQQSAQPPPTNGTQRGKFEK